MIIAFTRKKDFDKRSTKLFLKGVMVSMTNNYYNPDFVSTFNYEKNHQVVKISCIKELKLKLNLKEYNLPNINFNQFRKSGVSPGDMCNKYIE